MYLELNKLPWLICQKTKPKQSSTWTNCQLGSCIEVQWVCVHRLERNPTCKNVDISLNWCCKQIFCCLYECKEMIFCQFFRICIAYLGDLQKFFTDNSVEFENHVLREMNEKLGVETVTTAAEFPFSNRIIECHNVILQETIYKMTEDITGCLKIDATN